MKVETLQAGEKNIKLLLSDTTVAQVNSIRRTILTDVPKMAISKVRFEMGVTDPDDDGEQFESVSALPDEIISHRLAMIPIPTFHDEFYFPEDDPANQGLPEEKWGSPASQVIYHCSVRGPGRNSEEETRPVTAADLNVLGDSKLQIQEDCRDIPLTILARGQYIEFYAYATLGRGRDHSKWCPAAGIGFHPRQQAVLEDKKRAKAVFDLKLKLEDGTNIDAKLFGKKGVIDDIEIVEQVRKALFHIEQASMSGGESGISLKDIDGEFIFKFEADGSMSPQEVFNCACRELSGRFANLGEQMDIAFS